MNIKNPITKITIVNDGDFEYQVSYATIEDGYYQEISDFAIGSGQQNTIDYMNMGYYNESDELDYYWFEVNGGEVSDMVNCTNEDGSIMVTDVTKEASVTITIS